MYMSVPLNRFLRGYESWTITKELRNKLKLFHMRYLRRVLNTKCSEVMYKK